MAVEGGTQASRAWKYAASARIRFEGLHPSLRGLAWAAAAGLLFVMLNAIMRGLSLALSPFQTQFLRYLFGLVVMLPFILRSGIAAYRPHRISGQFFRGGVHTLGLCLWFTAIPHISLADTTALGFTTPIFIMIGAMLMLGERARWERWLAALIGFAGVLIVVAPKLTGSGGGFLLVMLASSPMFAASFLLTKTLTKYDKTEVIVVWQAITVMLCSLPLGVLHWQMPSTSQWGLFLLCGLLGSAGHFCLTRSFSVADISATQSVKFLELVWAVAIGWLMFSDTPSRSTLIGGIVICGSTLWIARRESRRPAAA
jgi:drug/metabolite transporter (DMT)-like permease